VTAGSRPTDDAIREMLQARASRGGQVPFDASVVASEATRRAGARPRAMPLMPRLAVAMTSLAAVIVIGVLLARPFGNQPASAPPTGAQSSDSANGSPSPTPFATPRLLPPAEVGVLVRTRAAELAGTIVAVRGRLETDPSVRCRAFACATVLADSGGGFSVRPVGDIGQGPWDGSEPKDGTFALRITPSLDAGQPGVEYIGDLVNRDDGTFVVSVADILAGTVGIEGAYAAVDGWLVRTPYQSCGSDPHPPAGPAYGCPTDDWLTESAYQPLRPDGSSLGPLNAIYLPTGAYDHWAPDPAPFGRDSVGVEPRRATYLLQVVQASACGPTADCFVAPGNLRWQIVGRFDPIPNLEPPATPEASVPIPSVVPPPSGTAWTVADLADRASMPMPSGVFVVRAWLVATPVLRGLCVSSPGLPDYGCSERDWLTDQPFQPWISDGNTGSTRDPSVGLRVQNGAYATFAPDPATQAFGARGPRLGNYLVRATVHDTCELPPLPSTNVPCYGPLVIYWEIVAHLPDVAPIAPGGRPEMTLSPGVTPAPVGDTPCQPAGQPCG
jgi:hypothetical protein